MLNQQDATLRIMSFAWEAVPSMLSGPASAMALLATAVLLAVAALGMVASGERGLRALAVSLVLCGIAAVCTFLALHRVTAMAGWSAGAVPVAGSDQFAFVDAMLVLRACINTIESEVHAGFSSASRRRSLAG